MILILSEEHDQATNGVIDWLRLWKQPVLRINDSDEIRIREIRLSPSGNQVSFSLNDDTRIHTLSAMQAYWYRRGDVRLKAATVASGLALSEQVSAYLGKETRKLREFFLRELDRIPNRIGSIFDLNNNKLCNLATAAECGLLVPDTHIVTQTARLRPLLVTPKISKAIYNNFDVFAPGYRISSYTSQVAEEDIPAGEALFPSLVQDFIDKQFDVRVFYLRGKTWAAAVFSQNDAQTRTDYRRYNDGRPNRAEAISLPGTLRARINKLMKRLGMACGSLDFALTSDGRFYFLEVNPVGQFSTLSFSCGFNLEKAIATELCKPASS